MNQEAVTDQRCPSARTNSTTTKLAIATQGRRIVTLATIPKSHASSATPKTPTTRGSPLRRLEGPAKVNKRANQAAPAMYPALRSRPSCAPVNRDHARQHERKSEFCFEIGNETRNPRRRGPFPIKCCRVPWAQVAKKPNHKSGCVNRPADAFGICHPTSARFCAAVATRRAASTGVTTVPVRPSFFGHTAFFRVQTAGFASNLWSNERLL